jgi:fumarate hydratase class II
LALVTAIAPIVGYDAAARIFKRALQEDISIREAILREKAVPPEKLDEILNLRELTKGGRAA